MKFQGDENRLRLTGDDTIERVRALHDRILEGATPGCKDWWKKQPVNFLEETINDLFRVIERRNPQAIERAFQFAESELALYVRFHGQIVRWVEAVIAIPNGEKLSVRIVPDDLVAKARDAGVLVI